eukprot:9501232-Pyramimonas_sp.AAC.1
MLVLGAIPLCVLVLLRLDLGGRQRGRRRPRRRLGVHRLPSHGFEHRRHVLDLSGIWDAVCDHVAQGPEALGRGGLRGDARQTTAANSKIVFQADGLLNYPETDGHVQN